MSEALWLLGWLLIVGGLAVVAGGGPAWLAVVGVGVGVAAVAVGGIRPLGLLLWHGLAEVLYHGARDEHDGDRGGEA